MEADNDIFAAVAQELRPLNTTKDIHDIIGIPESTLSEWRGSGIGPQWVKIGRRVMYPKEEIIACLRANLHTNREEY